MKKLVVALAALALAAPALAQTQTQTQGRSQLGLGIAIVPLEQIGTIQLYVPFQISPELRLEPSVGLGTSDTGAGDRTDITLGMGVFAMRRVAAPVDMYFGGRLKLNFASNDPGESGTDISLAGALGSEYYFVPNFSLGLEGQLGFYSNSEASGDDSGVFTNGLAFLRMYF